MHAHLTRPDAALRDDPSRTADHGRFPREGSVRVPRISDEQILTALFELFAGRAFRVLGQPLDWWIETLQCDLAPKAAAGVALSALSQWPFDQRAGADGVAELRAQLLQRARLLIDRSARDTGEVAL
ncbi:hypothetical protein [Achromobacter sp.]|uniref:hypothetical protein n=1 Tax=Achromobacter sp. TaxID=134375 RepID=UPI003C707BDE